MDQCYSVAHTKEVCSDDSAHTHAEWFNTTDGTGNFASPLK
jgi:hypothetical protein